MTVKLRWTGSAEADTAAEKTSATAPDRKGRNMKSIMRRRHDPEGLRLPIKLDSATNGEFAPVPLAPVHNHARALAHDQATRNARRLRLTRRQFLISASGAASRCWP